MIEHANYTDRPEVSLFNGLYKRGHILTSSIEVNKD